jgi:hypothetical protein
MFARQSPLRTNRLTMIALAVSMVGLFATSPSLAIIAIAANDAVVRISDDGRHLVLSGILLCDDAGAGDQINLYLTVIQRQGTQPETRAAIAEGSTHFVCTGGFFNDRWEVHVATHGDERFFGSSGWTVTFTGLAVSRNHSDTTDAFQWLAARIPVTQ